MLLYFKQHFKCEIRKKLLLGTSAPTTNYKVRKYFNKCAFYEHLRKQANPFVPIVDFLCSLNIDAKVEVWQKK